MGSLFMSALIIVIVAKISLIMHNVPSKGSAFTGKLFRVRSLDLEQHKSILVKSKKFL